LGVKNGVEKKFWKKKKVLGTPDTVGHAEPRAKTRERGTSSKKQKKEGRGKKKEEEGPGSSIGTLVATSQDKSTGVQRGKDPGTKTGDEKGVHKKEGPTHAFVWRLGGKKDYTGDAWHHELNEGKKINPRKKKGAMESEVIKSENRGSKIKVDRERWRFVLGDRGTHADTGPKNEETDPQNRYVWGGKTLSAEKRLLNQAA